MDEELDALLHLYMLNRGDPADPVPHDGPDVARDHRRAGRPPPGGVRRGGRRAHRGLSRSRRSTLPPCRLEPEPLDARCGAARGLAPRRPPTCWPRAAGGESGVWRWHAGGAFRDVEAAETFVVLEGRAGDRVGGRPASRSDPATSACSRPGTETVWTPPPPAPLPERVSPATASAVGDGVRSPSLGGALRSSRGGCARRCPRSGGAPTRSSPTTPALSTVGKPRDGPGDPADLRRPRRAPPHPVGPSFSTDIGVDSAQEAGGARAAWRRRSSAGLPS